jgi:hypothetical protein
LAKQIVANPAGAESFKTQAKITNDVRARKNAGNVKADEHGNIIGKDGKHYRLENGKKIETDPKTGKDLAVAKPTPQSAAPKLNVPAGYRGWTLNGKPYTGPEYSGYALDRGTYTSMSRSGKSMAPYKLRWINQIKPRLGDLDTGDTDFGG